MANAKNFTSKSQGLSECLNTKNQQTSLEPTKTDSNQSMQYSEITHENINVILDKEQPFLCLAGGTINCVDIVLDDGLLPCIKLVIMGKVVMIQGYKERITRKIKTHFMIPGLRVEYERGDYDIFADQIYE